MTFIVERRRPAFTPELLARVGIAWAMIAALLLVSNIPGILAHRFPDPDDTLRLVQVRDLIAGQGWFDLTQHRIDAAGGGVPMHWSRLVDLPIAAVILALRGFIGQGPAEAVALILIPLLTLGVALLLAGRIAWRVVGDEAAGFACLAMALSVPLVLQMRPMRIDHHGWQIVCALAAVNGLMARSPRWGGWAAGSAIAVWLSISIEGLPVAAAICGVAALRWLRDRHDAQWFVATMQSLAVASLALFAVTRGPSALTQYCDAISPGHLGGFAIAAIGATALARLKPLPNFALVGALGLIAAMGGAAMLLAAPQCAGGAFAEIDPLVAKFWYQGVGEGLPVWHQDLRLALQIVVPPLVGLIAAIKLAGRSGGWLRRWWQDYAMILAASLLLTLLVSRAGAVAGALASVPLGWQMREWLRSARMRRRPGDRALMIAGMALAVLPAMPLTVLAMARPAQAAHAAKQPRGSTCAISQSVAALRREPRGEILAPLDIGPQLLYETQHSVIATGHHRGESAMRAVITIFTGSEAEARAALEKRGTPYLVMCPDLVEPARYAAAAPEGFMAALLDDRVPAWLEPLPVPGGGSMRAWRVTHSTHSSGADRP